MINRLADEGVTSHFGGLLDAHYFENSGSDIGENTIGKGGVLTGGDINTGHGVERVGCVGSSVGVDGIVGIAVVGDDNHFVVGCFSGFDSVFYAVVDGFYCFFDSFVDAGVTYHVAICVVNDDEIVFFALDGLNEFVFYFICTHFGLEVVGGYFGGSNKDAFFTLVGSFATAIEEECYVGIFRCFGNVKL